MGYPDNENLQIEGMVAECAPKTDLSVRERGESGVDVSSTPDAESLSLTTQLERVPLPLLREALNHFNIAEMIRTLYSCNYTASSELKMLAGFAQDEKLSAASRMKATDLIHRRLMTALERSGIFGGQTPGDNDGYVQTVTAAAAPITPAEFKTTHSRVKAARQVLKRTREQSLRKSGNADPVFATDQDVPGTLAKEVIDVVATEQRRATPVGLGHDPEAEPDSAGATHMAVGGANPTGEPQESDGGDAAPASTPHPEPTRRSGTGGDHQEGQGGDSATGIEGKGEPKQWRPSELGAESVELDTATDTDPYVAGPAVCFRPTKKPVGGTPITESDGIGGQYRKSEPTD